jgi:hypothetical protein
MNYSTQEVNTYATAATRCESLCERAIQEKRLERRYHARNNEKTHRGLTNGDKSQTPQTAVILRATWEQTWEDVLIIRRETLT